MTNVANIDPLDALGLDRVVIVRRNANGPDNRAPLDGIVAATDRGCVRLGSPTMSAFRRCYN